MGDILFLAHRIPYPPDRGDKIRSFHVLRHLARLGRVHLACFADDAADAVHLGALAEALDGRLASSHVEVRRPNIPAAAARALLGGKPLSLTLFDSAAMRRYVASRLADPKVEAIYAFSSQMAQFVPPRTRQTFVMDFVDMDSAKFAAYFEEGAGPMRLVHRREARRLRAHECAVAARADASLLVSNAEADLFRRQTGAANVHALSNGIDSSFFNPGADFPRLGGGNGGEGPMLLFTGQMDYRPNVDAVRWFAREVAPRVPGSRFVIAGRNPAPEVRALAGDDVVVTGAVDDMRSWLAAADVVVAPLKIARGIQNKVLEAMAMARPVVASPAAFEGIEAQAGRDLIVADGAEAMAAEVARLLADPARARGIGQAARKLVTETYSWDARLALLAEIFTKRTPHSPSPPRKRGASVSSTGTDSTEAEGSGIPAFAGMTEEETHR